MMQDTIYKDRTKAEFDNLPILLSPDNIKDFFSLDEGVFQEVVRRKGCPVIKIYGKFRFEKHRFLNWYKENTYLKENDNYNYCTFCRSGLYDNEKIFIHKMPICTDCARETFKQFKIKFHYRKTININLKFELKKQKKCSYCNKLINKNNRQIDHFIPVSIKDIVDEYNLYAVCRDCNAEKGAKTPSEYIDYLKKYCKDSEKVSRVEKIYIQVKEKCNFAI